MDYCLLIGVCLLMAIRQTGEHWERTEHIMQMSETSEKGMDYFRLTVICQVIIGNDYKLRVSSVMGTFSVLRCFISDYH